MESSMLSSFFLLISCLIFITSSSFSPLFISSSIEELQGYTGISEFRVINRRILVDCHDPNPYLAITINANSSLSDEEVVTATVSGVLIPDESDWIAMISPSSSDVSDCPLNSLLYKETGDLSSLPLLCHYPVKAQFLSNDASYLSCGNEECHEKGEDGCSPRTCSGSVEFHVINIRTDVEFVLFTGGFDTPCLLRRSNPVGFSNPSAPLYAHLASVDSTASSMRVTWVSGDKNPQKVVYGDKLPVTSEVATFTRDDMCGGSVPSAAKDFGWHDPGYIHTAVMTGLQPSQSYYYSYGSDSVGWSPQTNFRTPPAGGSDELRFLAYGDMGKAPFDLSVEHYIQPGSLSVVRAITDEVAAGDVDSVFHIGDISYATGFLVEWDYFLNLITPIASHVTYMTAIGNHERDYPDSGSVYDTPDSGGECGAAYENYFQMPTDNKDEPWYSIEQASVHFTVISTEHDWSENSEQYEWIKGDLSSVDRTRTPWIIFAGHRPMYSSSSGILPSVDPDFLKSVEPLLMKYKVDLALFGHVHNYERTCAVYREECLGIPRKDDGGVDTYNNNNYTAPVHLIVGMAGFTLDKFPDKVASWSLTRISEFGYIRGHSTRTDLSVEFVNSSSREVRDRFHIIKGGS